GFIGSHTAEACLARGDRVIGIDNFNDYYDPERKRTNVREIFSTDNGRNFSFIEGDIRNRTLLNAIFQEKPLSAIIHLAAMAGVRASVDDPWLYYDVNLTGTLNL